MGVLWNSPLAFICLLVILSANVDAKRGRNPNVRRVSPKTRPFQPMVAFICNKGAMFNSAEGLWKSDPTTGCLLEGGEIILYCQKKFPSSDITHFRAARNERVIPGWCEKTEKGGCEGFNAFKVRPILCLADEDQTAHRTKFRGKSARRGSLSKPISDIPALVVPTHCHFDHKNDPTKCDSHELWTLAAKTACAKDYQMRVESFAMLSSCDGDAVKSGSGTLFHGVEYVCCPLGFKPSILDEKEIVEMKEKPANEERAKAEEAVMEKWDETEEPKGEKKVDPRTIEASPVIDKYLHEVGKKLEYAGEHGLFKNVRNALKKERQEKIDKLLDMWAVGKHRIEDLKLSDPVRSAKMNRVETTVFQQKLAKVDEEEEERLGKAMEVHQAHVYTNFNEKKRAALTKFITKLEAYDPTEEQSLLRALKKYLYLEQKDARHCIHHYKIIKTSHPALGPALLQPTIKHLRTISQRMNQSINLLDHLKEPKLVLHMRGQVEKWFQSSFVGIDNSIKRLILSVSQLHPDFPKTLKPEVEDPARESPRRFRGRLAKIGSKKIKGPLMRVVQEKSASIDVVQESITKPLKKAIPSAMDVVQEKLTKFEDVGMQVLQEGVKVAGKDEAVSKIVKEGLKIWKDMAFSSKKKQSMAELPPLPELYTEKEKPRGEKKQGWYATEDLTEDEHDYMKKGKSSIDTKEKVYGKATGDAVKPSGAAMAKSNAASMSEHKMALAEEEEHSESASSKLTAGSTIAIVSAVIAAVILVAVIAVSFRLRRGDGGKGAEAESEYEEVAEEDLSPEEMHVRKMQMNGYENPTYRLLEGQQ